MTDASQGPFSERSIPEISLAGGGNLPSLGLAEPVGPEKLAPSLVKSAISRAIALKYRHFQTSSSSYLEPYVGESIAEALGNGSVDLRKDFFISSKIQFNSADSDSIITSLRTSLQALNLEYVDMFLIEWPKSAEEGSFSASDFISSWEAMERCKSLGLTTFIGVCNFSSEMLERLLKLGNAVPSVNQVGMNPMWKDTVLRELCAENNITIIVSCTIDGKDEAFDFSQFQESEDIQQIEEKTPAEIFFRWAYEKGAALLLQSLTVVDIVKMLEIFD